MRPESGRAGDATAAAAGQKELETALPELKLISDPALRLQTEDAWLRAWAMSGLQSLEDAPLLAGDVGLRRGVGLEHIRMTARLAHAMARELKDVEDAVRPDVDVCVAGALLHDVGKLAAVGRSLPGAPTRHVVFGGHVALAAQLPPEVVHIVAAHSFDGDHAERSLNCMLVRFADFLSADLIFRRELGKTGNQVLKARGLPTK
jgi:putative nucleotidyltransferase with HDIG domain